ncbi:hypothetical protein ON010_g5798 [Phytophthora cinnamomi]|nr:hypothetical protein ON010_g5798 [Phytophthora cinnamomi]
MTKSPTRSVYPKGIGKCHVAAKVIASSTYVIAFAIEIAIAPAPVIVHSLSLLEPERRHPLRQQMRQAAVDPTVPNLLASHPMALLEEHSRLGLQSIEQESTSLYTPQQYGRPVCVRSNLGKQAGARPSSGFDGRFDYDATSSRHDGTFA